MTDPFVPHAPQTEPELGLVGPLTGLRLAVKDLFDIPGLPTGAGNPRWLQTHEVPQSQATAVTRLREAGASLVGKTITDELAWSLNGSNVHYGTPDNPAAPGRLPGGSSSGSASAVALGLADIGLGTDTGGSIRVPASYCGLYGLRPSTGRVPLDGVVPLSPSFDTAGILTRDAATLAKAGAALLREWRDAPAIERLLVPHDIWSAQHADTRSALMAAVEWLGLEVDRTPLFEDSDALEEARIAYATIQAFEAWQTHGEWITTAEPDFGPGVGARFARASELTRDDLEGAQRHRAEIAALTADRLGDGIALAIPAAPGPAPELGADLEREAVVRLTCIAGLTRAPAVAVPAETVAGLPVGLQLVASPGGDEALLNLVSAKFTGSG